MFLKRHNILRSWHCMPHADKPDFAMVVSQVLVNCCYFGCNQLSTKTFSHETPIDVNWAVCRKPECYSSTTKYVFLFFKVSFFKHYTILFVTLFFLFGFVVGLEGQSKFLNQNQNSCVFWLDMMRQMCNSGNKGFSMLLIQMRVRRNQVVFVESDVICEWVRK